MNEENSEVDQPRNDKRSDLDDISSSRQQNFDVGAIENIFTQIASQESVSKEDIKNLVMAVRKLLDSVKIDAKHRQDLESLRSQGMVTVEDGLKSLKISYKEEPRVKEDIQKFFALKDRLRELDQNYMDDNSVNEEKDPTSAGFHLLRPIMVAKIGFLIQRIGLSIFE